MHIQDNEYRFRVLAAGDSITRGALGRSYIDLLQQVYPSAKIVNLGQDGDTLSGIRRRTIRYLKRDANFNIVTIAAGHNDVILPALSEMSPIKASIPVGMAMKGSVPSKDELAFEGDFSAFLDEVTDLTSAKVIVSTLSCLNESPDSPTAVKRATYNKIIRRVVQEKSAELAEVGEAFDVALSGSNTVDYFMDSVIAPMLGDRIMSRDAASAARLSSRRGLKLTIDGVHLNEDGARIYAAEISRVLQRILGDIAGA